MYRLLRAEELCRGEKQGASQCPLAQEVRCAACGYHWIPESGDVNDPGFCPNCDQFASTAQRCNDCPVLDVEHYRHSTAAGRMLERVLEHDFDVKHYRVDAGSINADVREGLKVLESERVRWEKETREEMQKEWEEKQRIREMQQKSGRNGF